MTLMGLIKDKKRFLLAQCGMNVFYIAGNLCLGGISGAIANLVTMLRNIVTLRWKLNVPIKLLFIALQLGLTLYFGVSGVVMWLPVAGVLLFTWFIDTENMALLKVVVIISQMLWGIYDLSIKNYATFPFDIATCITNGIALCSLLKAKKEV